MKEIYNFIQTANTRKRSFKFLRITDGWLVSQNRCKGTTSEKQGVTPQRGFFSKI